MDPDWEDLRHFAALARALHLGRAAAELRTSQATVLRRVRAAEATLQTPLFVRRRDGHRLTRAGEELAEALGPAAEQIEGGVRRLLARHVPGEGRIRILTTELVANWILLPAIGSLVSETPAARIEIEASPTSRSLVDDDETLAIRFVRPERGPYVVRRLSSIPFSLYGRRDLAPDGFIGWSGESRPAALSRWIGSLHRGREPSLALNTMAGHLEGARQGLGVAGLPTFLGEREPLLSRIAGTPQLLLDAWLVVPEVLAGAARSKRVTRWIVAAFKQVQT